MSSEATFQLVAVITGGLLAIAGGILTNLLLDRRRLKQQESNLALAFRGEITAILELVKERKYVERFAQLADRIDQTREPFLMPFRVRFEYDRVYEANVGQLGLLRSPLPQEIPLFYTRLASIMEDLSSLGDGTYAALDLDTLLRIYRDLAKVTTDTVAHGERILAAISEQYG